HRCYCRSSRTSGLGIVAASRRGIDLLFFWLDVRLRPDGLSLNGLDVRSLIHEPTGITRDGSYESRSAVRPLTALRQQSRQVEDGLLPEYRPNVVCGPYSSCWQ